ncbi:hypothetical protein MRX96_020775 [Rhipicephalus microplus]
MCDRGRRPPLVSHSDGPPTMEALVSWQTQAPAANATRARTRKSATPSKSESSRSNPSKGEQYIERLLRAVADIGLGVPAKKEKPRRSARKFIYSAAMLRSLNVQSRASTSASRSEHQDRNLDGSSTSTSNVHE